MSGEGPGKKAFSSKLLQMKFMQRATEKTALVEGTKAEAKKEAEAKWKAPAGAGPKRCMVITESDPLPPAALGRFSFQNFNPATEKLQQGGAAGGVAGAAGGDAPPVKEESVNDTKMASVLGKRLLAAEEGSYKSLRDRGKRKRNN